MTVRSSAAQPSQQGPPRPRCCTLGAPGDAQPGARRAHDSRGEGLDQGTAPASRDTPCGYGLAARAAAARWGYTSKGPWRSLHAHNVQAGLAQLGDHLDAFGLGADGTDDGALPHNAATTSRLSSGARAQRCSLESVRGARTLRKAWGSE